jgi:hypothetical protein
MTEIDDLTPHTAPLPHSSNERDSRAGIVPEAGHRYEMVDAKAGGRSKMRRENPL